MYLLKSSIININFFIKLLFIIHVRKKICITKLYRRPIILKHSKFLDKCWNEEHLIYLYRIIYLFLKFHV